MTGLQRGRAYALVLVAAVVWWLPSILVGLALVGAFHLQTWRIVRRAPSPPLGGAARRGGGRAGARQAGGRGR